MYWRRVGVGFRLLNTKYKLDHGLNNDRIFVSNNMEKNGPRPGLSQFYLDQVRPEQFGYEIIFNSNVYFYIFLQIFFLHINI